MLQGVLFDWRLTLVHHPPNEWWVGEALRRIARDATPTVVAPLCAALEVAASLPEIAAGELTCDCSAAAHREWSLAYFRAAGLDDELALSLYDIDFDPIAHPFYPDVAPVFDALHARGCKIAVVSDIHVDLRPEFAAAGLDVDAFVLSFEHGVQKPDARMFQLALDALGTDARDALMVGDRPSKDGGAVAHGIMTLLLPTVGSPDVPVGLDRVLRLLG